MDASVEYPAGAQLLLDPAFDVPCPHPTVEDAGPWILRWAKAAARRQRDRCQALGQTRDDVAHEGARRGLIGLRRFHGLQLVRRHWGRGYGDEWRAYVRRSIINGVNTYLKQCGKTIGTAATRLKKEDRREYEEIAEGKGTGEGFPSRTERKWHARCAKEHAESQRRIDLGLDVRQILSEMRPELQSIAAWLQMDFSRQEIAERLGVCRRTVDRKIQEIGEMVCRKLPDAAVIYRGRAEKDSSFYL
jgi:DNA-directed RNA polymerase specialized sigma24 family protein